MATLHLSKARKVLVNEQIKIMKYYAHTLHIK